MNKYYCFEWLLLKNGWQQYMYVGIDDSGIVNYLSFEKPLHTTTIETVKGAALPGFQNAHSHAFQFAMAGTAEQHKAGTADDFWSWREAMYRCAQTITPQQMEDVAYKLYSKLIQNGYTSVAEFHYLHHDINGKPYNNLAEMGERLVAAAQKAGIKITLIPVYYNKGDFDKEPQPRQQRFISNSVDAYCKLLESSKNSVKQYHKASLGFGVHSLRAATAEDIIQVYRSGSKQLPFHIHVAEQLAEVQRCLQHLKQRPAEWLLDNLPLNENFHLVHCIHLNDDEVKRLALSNANLILCPVTEANLGDGIFRLTDYVQHNGNFSIGTDSHVGLNPLEDLRWLDYAQRLIQHKRNIFNNGAATLINKTFGAGVKAMGRNASDYFALNQPLDAVIFNISSQLPEKTSGNSLLSTIVYTCDTSAITGTIINGEWKCRLTDGIDVHK